MSRLSGRRPLARAARAAGRARQGRAERSTPTTTTLGPPSYETIAPDHATIARIAETPTPCRRDVRARYGLPGGEGARPSADADRSRCQADELCATLPIYLLFDAKAPPGGDAAGRQRVRRFDWHLLRNLQIVKTLAAGRRPDAPDNVAAAVAATRRRRCLDVSRPGSKARPGHQGHRPESSATSWTPRKGRVAPGLDRSGAKAVRRGATRRRRASPELEFLPPRTGRARAFRYDFGGRFRCRDLDAAHPRTRAFATVKPRPIPAFARELSGICSPITSDGRARSISPSG